MRHFIAKRQGLPKETKASLRQMARAAWNAVPPLLMPVIILGDILTGVFTAAEPAVIAVVYGVLLSMVVYGELRLRGIQRIPVAAARLTGMVMLVVGMCITFAWIVTIEQGCGLLSSTGRDVGGRDRNGVLVERAACAGVGGGHSSCSPILKSGVWLR